MCSQFYIYMCIPIERVPGCIRQHTSAYVSIRQHTSAYVSIRVCMHVYMCIPLERVTGGGMREACSRMLTYAHVCSIYMCIPLERVTGGGMREASEFFLASPTAAPTAEFARAREACKRHAKRRVRNVYKRRARGVHEAC